MIMVYFLLPTFNEEDNLPDLFDAINESVQDYHIVLVNDGSKDRTEDIAQEYAKRMPISVISHAQNRGLGAALKTGILHIVKHGTSGAVVVTMDSDLTHDPKLVHAMICEIENGFDVVVASRYVSGGQQLSLPLSRRILSWGINMLIRMKGSKVLDNTSGFRCISIELLRRSVEQFGNSFITTTEFTSTVQILLRLQTTGARVREIPLILDYGKKRGMSKMKIPRTICAYFRLLAQHRMWAIPEGPCKPSSV